MTGSLHEILKEGDMVHIKVDSNCQCMYFPDWLHSQIGHIWGIDEDHIWIKCVVTNKYGEQYISGPHRYCWLDITVERISL